MYDKLGEFEEAEKYYLKIMEKDDQAPRSYYIMADFYNKYNKSDLAKAMYEKRIALDPKAPDGYLYYASYVSDRRQWDLSIDNHEKRILAIYDQDTLLHKLDVTRIKDELTQIEAIKKNMDTIKKHRSLGKEEKTRLIDEAQTRLDEFKPEEELNQTLAEKEKLVEEALNTKWDKIDAQTDEIKTKLAEAFYTLGVVCWNKSYQTPPHLMGPEERLVAVNKGMDACNSTLKLQPENHQAYAFIGLLWRQKIVAEPLKNDEYMAEWQKAYDKAKDLREKRLRRQKLQEKLEQMGKE
jgi:tetratricopeptide (TPR) repeat protein